MSWADVVGHVAHEVVYQQSCGPFPPRTGAVATWANMGMASLEAMETLVLGADEANQIHSGRNRRVDAPPGSSTCLMRGSGTAKGDAA